jgi:glycosyltransferase involved in cell wall biosynthesis
VDVPSYQDVPPDEYYLAGGRLIPYKQIGLAVQACSTLGLPLKVFGDGRDRPNLEALAGTNVTFLGWVDEHERRELFARCRAFIFPGEEDFGITPLEAMAAGRPVIAYGAGGALDTVREGVTGRFFRQQNAAALAVALAASCYDTYDAQTIRTHAEGFSKAVFQARMQACIAEQLAKKPT